MINRELIRIKVVQLVYAYYMNGGKPMDVCERELITSLSKAHHLYNHLLDLIVAITREERLRYEIHLQRAEREGKEKPSDRFVNNRFALQLAENIQLAKFKEEQHLDWREDVDFVRRICNMIESSEVYKDYMAAESVSYNDDRELWRQLYRMLIERNDELEQLLEDKSLYWNDDKDIVDTFVLKTIKRFEEKNGAEQELLSAFEGEEKKEFAIELFRATIKYGDEYQDYIEQFSNNWELDRMPFIDLVIMQIALAEILNFPVIPISVSMTEYVYLSKIYSTPKSANYINAMLDTIARMLIKEGKLMKQMK